MVVAVLAITLAGCLQPGMSGKAATVVLQPGDDVQAAIDANPPGTTFLLRPGLYREQQLEPKDDQAFVADGGEVILRGARVYTGWERRGALWALPGLPEPLRVGTTTRDIDRYGPPEVIAREILFLDGELYRRVGKLADLGPGLWYRDGDYAILSDDPTGLLTELAVTPEAFHGRASGVLLRGLTVERYASDTHAGAIEAVKGRNWRLENVVSQFNHSMGLRTGDGLVVEGGRYSDNGQLGMTIPGDDVVIRNAEICRNNNLGHRGNWEAGGIKIFAKSERVLIENNVVCDNASSGIWTDGSTRDPVIRRNRVYGNEGIGIYLELTYGGLVAENFVSGHLGQRRKHSGYQIRLMQTSGAEVRDNLVVVPAEQGNGIGVWHKKRGPWISVNNHIHHNRIIYLGQRGFTGAQARDDEANLRDNRFDHNTYVVPEGSFDEYWWFDGAPRSHADLANFGVEPNGTLIRATDPASYADWSIAN
jgi:parallel beta-helix repeat protein